MTGVLSSSPQKSCLPSTSKEEPESEEDEDHDTSLLAVPLAPELRGKEEEEIDDSLFAAVMMPQPEAEDEIDDDSLLAVEMPQSKPKEEPEVDYLEGMTAEMFWNDGEFDQCDIHNEEDEVEALPDAHYGLLGSNSALLEPQGCMDDLPEEVLREVLCLVPARDLYRSVSLVCHRWRNIVEDNTVRWQ